jgi:hypothetical protein
VIIPLVSQAILVLLYQNQPLHCFPSLHNSVFTNQVAISTSYWFPGDGTFILKSSFVYVWIV